MVMIKKATILSLILFFGTVLLFILSSSQDIVIATIFCIFLIALGIYFWMSITGRIPDDSFVITPHGIYSVDDELIIYFDNSDNNYIHLSTRETETLYWDYKRDFLVSVKGELTYPLTPTHFGRVISKDQIDTKYKKIERKNGKIIYWDKEEEIICVDYRFENNEEQV